MNKLLKISLLMIILIALVAAISLIPQVRFEVAAEQITYPPPDSANDASGGEPYPPPSSPGKLPPYPPPVSTNSPIPIVDGLIENDNALIDDAKMYASTFEVTLEDAIWRLKLQDIIGELNAKLVKEESDTFAGLWIQHKPNYRVIVRFTENGKATIQQYINNSPLTGIIEVRNANANLKYLEEILSHATQICNELNISHYSSINIVENQVELYVIDPSDLYEEIKDANIVLPENVNIIKVNELPQEIDHIYGGLELSDCTSGFSVINNSGIKGITTAGHCDDTQYYNGVELPFMAGTEGGDNDIQWNRGDHEFLVLNYIYDGYTVRRIYNEKFRVNQTVGSFVCKYGITTGYGCGEIASTSVNGVNVRVDKPVDEGDSGGPWFFNNTAFGNTIYKCTLSDGSPCAIYGPVDHIYNTLDLRILPIRVYLPITVKSH